MKKEEFLLKVWSPQAEEGLHFFVSTKKVGTGIWKDHSFKWPIKKTELRKFFKEYSTNNYNLYFCPHPFRKPKRHKDFVVDTSFLWADLDAAHPDKCKPIPQIAWESSPKRYAALWQLTDCLNPAEIEQVNRKLTYDNGADNGCWNLTRVLRIPGTRNHKYENSPYGRLMRFNTKKYGLEKFNTGVEELDAVQVLNKWKKRIPFTTLKLLTSKSTEQGKRSDILWKLNNELHSIGLTSSEIYTLLKASAWNKFSGRRDEEEQLQREIEKAHHVKGKAVLAGIDVEEEIPDLICAADVEPQTVQWLWPPYMAFGKLTIIEGDPGLGKSFLTTKLAFHIANGVKFPNCSLKTKGVVCLFNAEDGLRDTIVPRLSQFKTNMKNVRIHPNDKRFSLDIEGFILLEHYIRTYKPKMIIIDPLVGYLDTGLDINKANDMRSVTKQLAALAEKYNVAVIAIRHLTKSTKEKAIYRGMGSIDITGAARSVIHMGQDPDDNEGRVMCHIKNNIGEKGRAMKFRLVRGSAVPFRWAGECDYTPNDLVSQDGMVQGISEMEKAKTFLKEFLDERKMKDDIVIAGESRGISKSALTKARKELKLKTVKVGRKYYWEPL